MRTIKNPKSVIKVQEFKAKHKQPFILQLIKNNLGNGYIRKGNFSDEIIWDSKSYLFPSDKVKTVTKGIFLFAMVRKDCRIFLNNGNQLKLPKKYPVNEYNDSFVEMDSKITGTDLNHAYWRIAFNLGVITHNTYLKGLNDDYKTTRLAALSSLGAGKEYFRIKDGVVLQEVVNIGLNEDLKKIYKVVRYTCYKYMQQLKSILKDDFICYKTDCIYYVDTKENKKMVRDFLKKQNMEYKQLYAIKKALHEQD